MLRVLGIAGAFPLLVAAAVPLAAQDFIPPDRGGRPTTSAPAQTAGTGINLGVFGFSTRGGVQVNRGSQGVIGSTIDFVQLGTPLVRLRSSLEMGFGSAAKSVGVNVEAVYRFQPDQAPAIPYLGLGLGYYDDSSITRVWPTVVMGFEMTFKRNINWLVEYHALDGLSRSRFFVGLATRGTN